MRRKSLKHQSKSKRSAGKVMTGLVLGSVLGATVGWLTAPTSGLEMRRRLSGEIKGAREKAQTGLQNIERQARELAAEVKEEAKTSPGRQRNITPPVG